VLLLPPPCLCKYYTDITWWKYSTILLTLYRIFSFASAILSLLASQVPRTNTASANPLWTDSGGQRTEFFTNDLKAEYRMRATIKADPALHDPPYHWHKYQMETIFVHSDTMRANLEGSDQIVHPGQSVTVEPGLRHLFVNDSDKEPLDVSIGLDRNMRDRDEAFFRNLFSYQEDCQKHGKPQNVTQLLLFPYFFNCYPGLSGPKFLTQPISQALTFVIGVVVGKWLLGFQGSYPEYYTTSAVGN